MAGGDTRGRAPAIIVAGFGHRFRIFAQCTLCQPTNGNLVDEIFRLIPQWQVERRISILLMEQNANKALTVASYGYVLETGSLPLEGQPSAPVNNPRVLALYLGG